MGPLQLRWYGLMYIIGFVCAYFVLMHLSRRENYDINKKEIEDLLAYGVVGLIVGARLGYCLFYNFGYYLSHPLKCLAIWEGGMSFHGGLIGLVLGGWLFSRLRNKSLIMLADMGALAATPGLFFGRIGNFINAELYGRVTDVPWGMVFPGAGGLPRIHPALRGLLRGDRAVCGPLFPEQEGAHRGISSPCSLWATASCVSSSRFFREPDPQLGFIIASITMGQVLSLLMVAAGAVLLITRLKSGGFHAITLVHDGFRGKGRSRCQGVHPLHRRKKRLMELAILSGQESFWTFSPCAFISITLHCPATPETTTAPAASSAWNGRRTQSTV